MYFLKLLIDDFISVRQWPPDPPEAPGKWLAVKLKGCHVPTMCATENFEDLVRKTKYTLDIPKQEPIRFLWFNCEIVTREDYDRMVPNDTLVVIRDGEEVDCKLG